MKAADVVGHTIVAVEQTRVQTNQGPTWHLEALVLDNGTRLYLHVREMDGDYAIHGQVVKAPRTRRTP